MTGTAFPAACFCLAVGAALGGLFLSLKLFRLLLRGGWLCTLLLDVCFCLLWTGAAFLCALVVDKGRPRLLSVGLQALGTWGAAAALDPFVGFFARLLRRWSRRARDWAARPVHALRSRVGRLLGRGKEFLRKKLRTNRPNRCRKQKKSRRIGKKRKKHLKNLRKPVYNGSTTGRCR